MRTETRLANIGTAWSQVLHIMLTWGDGDPKMTTSARVGRQAHKGATWAKRVAAFIDWLFREADHCYLAYQRDRIRRLGREQ